VNALLVNALLVPALAAALVALGAARWQPSATRAVAEPEPDTPRRLPPILRRARRADRRPPSPRAVAEWCDDLARQVRSGSTLRDSLTTLPHDPATRRATDDLRRRLDRGRSVADAVEPTGDAGPHLRLALRVVATAARLGGSPAPPIDRTAGVLRQRAADTDERRVHAAQAQMSAHVMTAVPLVMLVLLLLADRDVRAAATSMVGATCIGAGLSLNVIGSLWMRRIVGADR